MSGDSDTGRVLRTNRRKFLAATAGTASAVALAGCSGGGGDDTIRIGAPYLLSGVGEAIGEDSLNGAELAAEEINEDGGVDGKDLEIIPKDHAGSDAARVHRSLVTEDEVHGMIGLTSSGVAISTAGLIGELGVPQILCDIGSPYVTEHDVERYGEDVAVGNQYRFRANAGTVQSQWAIALDVEQNLPDVETVGFVGPDYAFGHQEWEYFQAYSDARGLDLEYNEDAVQFIDLGETDMTASLSQVIDQEPDLLITSQWSDDQVTFTRQAMELDVEEHVDHVLLSLGVDVTQLLALGEDQPPGWRFHGWHFPGTPDIEAQHEWVQAYQDLHGREPGGFSVSSYEAVHHYAQVIEENGEDPDDIVDGLEQNVFDGPRGEHEFLEDSHQAPVGVPFGVSGEFNEELGRVELEDLQFETPDPQELRDMLDGSDLPAGI